MDSGSAKIVFACDEFRLYKDGHIVRASGVEDTVPAGFDADTGIISKDVVIDAASGVAARIHLPTIQAAPSSRSDGSGAATATQLPILVFFHGGGFVVGSPAQPMYHRYVNSLAASARVIVVSVRYRLAPENLLPAAYDDAWAALNWVASGADPWLSDHGDLGRVFIAGVSAGANIAHNMAMAAGVSDLRAAEPPRRIEGVILLHPSFSGKQRMGDEEEEFWRDNNKRWMAIFPGAMDGPDDPRINPMAAGAPSLAKLAGVRLLVCTTSEDPRALRGRAYCDAVRASGWPEVVEWFESHGVGHGFFVLDHSSSEAGKLMDRVVSFVGGH